MYILSICRSYVLKNWTYISCGWQNAYTFLFCIHKQSSVFILAYWPINNKNFMACNTWQECCEIITVHYVSFLSCRALITALVYFISLPSHIQSPILVPPPSVAMFNSSLTFTDPNNSSYTLYMGTAMYRYIYHYSLLISGQVDLPGVTKLLQSVVSAAWSNWTLTNKGKLEINVQYWWSGPIFWELSINLHSRTLRAFCFSIIFFYRIYPAQRANT